MSALDSAYPAVVSVLFLSRSKTGICQCLWKVRIPSWCIGYRLANIHPVMAPTHTNYDRQEMARRSRERVGYLVKVTYPVAKSKIDKITVLIRLGHKQS